MNTEAEILLERVQAAVQDEYAIERELGRGGMAVVYLAKDLALHRNVAIKVMLPNLSDTEGIQDRFAVEARTVAHLDHPNIVTIYSVKERSGLHCFVMKYVEGRPLDTVLQDPRPVDSAAALSILSQVADALHFAHSEGIIHRDVKPSNIILDVRGRPVVTDFGIAKVTSGQSLTMTGSMLGTPAYMSPEQCRGKTATAASDQYSLGVMAFELLTGRTPFEGSFWELLQAHTTRPAPGLKDFRSEVATEVDELVQRMLAKAPEDRWPSLGEVSRRFFAAIPDARSPAQLKSEIAAIARGLEPEPSRPGGQPQTTPAAALAVSPAEPLLEVDQEVQLQVSELSGASLGGVSIRWQSEDPSVASVDSTGRVTGRAEGFAKITASAGAAVGRAQVTVRARVAEDTAMPTARAQPVDDATRVADLPPPTAASPAAPEEGTRVHPTAGKPSTRHPPTPRDALPIPRRNLGRQRSEMDSGTSTGSGSWLPSSWRTGRSLWVGGGTGFLFLLLGSVWILGSGEERAAPLNPEDPAALLLPGERGAEGELELEARPGAGPMDGASASETDPSTPAVATEDPAAAPARPVREETTGPIRTAEDPPPSREPVGDVVPEQTSEVLQEQPPEVVPEQTRVDAPPGPPDEAQAGSPDPVAPEPSGPDPDDIRELLCGTPSVPRELLSSQLSAEPASRLESLYQPRGEADREALGSLLGTIRDVSALRVTVRTAGNEESSQGCDWLMQLEFQWTNAFGQPRSRTVQLRVALEAVNGEARIREVFGLS